MDVFTGVLTSIKFINHNLGFFPLCLSPPHFQNWPLSLPRWRSYLPPANVLRGLHSEPNPQSALGLANWGCVTPALCISTAGLPVMILQLSCHLLVKLVMQIAACSNHQHGVRSQERSFLCCLTSLHLLELQFLLILYSSDHLLPFLRNSHLHHQPEL